MAKTVRNIRFCCVSGSCVRCGCPRSVSIVRGLFEKSSAIQFLNSNKFLFSCSEILPSLFGAIFVNDIIWNLFDKILLYDVIVATIKDKKNTA